jgi:hypothetical protein
MTVTQSMPKSSAHLIMAEALVGLREKSDTGKERHKEIKQL